MAKAWSCPRILLALNVGSGGIIWIDGGKIWVYFIFKSFLCWHEKKDPRNVSRIYLWILKNPSTYKVISERFNKCSFLKKKLLIQFLLKFFWHLRKSHFLKYSSFSSSIFGTRANFWFLFFLAILRFRVGSIIQKNEMIQLSASLLVC